MSEWEESSDGGFYYRPNLTEVLETISEDDLKDTFGIELTTSHNSSIGFPVRTHSKEEIEMFWEKFEALYGKENEDE